ncbi:MAG: peptide transporter, permease protein [Verrucomicrobiota bacterium]|jgi:peptide/nickel transport system permease protein
MLKRLFIRIFWSGVTLLATAVIVFLLINVVPGDVAKVIAGPKASTQVLQEIHAKYHLDEPLTKRLGYYLWQLAHGDLGKSFVTDEPVAHAIFTRLPVTAALASIAVVIWMAIAMPLGVFTAKHRGTWFDRGVLVIATITLSLPSFWLARMLQYWFAYKFGWFPVAGLRGFASLLLPAISLAILFIGYYARLIHTNMVEVLDSPYVRAARAKGAPERVVLFRHALPNALIPVITILGMDVAGLLGGVLFTENVFALPGVGKLAVESVFNLDVPMIMGTVLVSATVVVAMNFVVDLLYRRIDPRIKDSV